MSVVRLVRALGGVTFLCLVMVPFAAASGGSAKAGYGGAAGLLAKTKSANGLPFTGLDLSLLIIGGMLLALLGMGLRRASRTRA
ncbi:MAG: hypothetical protein QOE29_2171 [Gaiellaceae bacterium]|nr:hypothetical protein [Gaiellaceae bacterium]